MKKIYFLFIVICTAAVFSAASCGESLSEAPSEPDEKSESSKDSAGDSQDISVGDELPDFKFNGAEIKILSNTDISVIHSDLVLDHMTGDRVNDAVFAVNAEVEERFDVKFKQLECGYTQAENMLKKTVKSGDNAYDIVMITDRYAVSLASDGKYFYYVDELPYVNLDKPYWDKSLNECVSIKGKNYYALGACMLSIYDLTGFLVFNKSMHENSGLDSVYNLVKDGKWTFDKFMDMSRVVTGDLNGDGEATEEDRFGIITHSGFTYPSFWCVNRAFLVDKDDGDIPYFNVPGNEKLFGIFDKLYELVTSGYEYSITRTPIKNGKNDQFDTLKMFEGGHGLFASASAFTAQSLNNMDTDFGIAPYPTINEKLPGEPYLSRLSYSMPFVVPSTADPEQSSVILEALCCAYYKSVIPEFRDITIKIKVVRDEESSEILEMLFANRVIDMGDSIWYADMRQKYEVMFTNKDNTFQAMTEKIQSKAEKLISQAIDSIDNAG